jgi:GNAT superfamily N-acetyltransferase
LRRWIEDPDFWGEVASRDGELAGHATFIPAARHTLLAEEEAGLAHLGNMFVRPAHWGTGVASRLMERALGAAAARGYRSMRLFVPEGQSRARRFYAREGFGAVGDPFDPGFGLPVLEYRRPLDRGDTRARA